MINEDQVEQLAIEWFKELGYDYLHGYDIAPDSSTPERNNYQIVLALFLVTSIMQAKDYTNLHLNIKTDLRWHR